MLHAMVILAPRIADPEQSAYWGASSHSTDADGFRWRCGNSSIALALD